MLTEFKSILKLTPDETHSFANFIKNQRKELIPSTKETVNKAIFTHKDEIDVLLNNNNISKLIIELRELCYEQFLLEESKFNAVILSTIAKEFNALQTILRDINSNLYTFRHLSEEQFLQKVGHLFGKFAGCISPYIYQLCLSNTQSRRTRAGKVFEGIIYSLYEYYGFSYDSQKSIGKKVFSSLGLGKVVDSILPSAKAFSMYRNKTIVGSMKTTLRERWQEVVEEISRSNLPNIHLLTVDHNIPVSKAKQMSEHNIVLVVTRDVKQKTSLNKMHNIIDFEAYFTKEIPQIMAYWRCNND